MQDTTLLDSREPLTMQRLRDHFRAHDFSAQTSKYKFKTASSEKNQIQYPTYDGSGTILESTGITIRSESI